MISFSLFLFHKINPPVITLFSISIIIFIINLFIFQLEKINISYILISLSISLLFGVNFLIEKSDFYKKSNVELPINFYITAYGTIIDFPELKNDLMRFCLQSEKFEYGGQSIKKSLNIRVTILGKTENISKGDRIRLNLKISKRVISKNFFQNPINNFFLSKKIHFSAFSKSVQMITVLKKHFFWHIIEKLRIGIKKKLKTKYQGNNESEINKKAFIKAILLGDRGDVTNDLKEKLLNSGIFHIFAISGAHIGIMSFLLIYLLHFIGIKRRTRLLITAISIVFYLIISGSNVPAQRAIIMGLTIIISKMVYQKADIYNIIAFSGIFILLLSPLDILNPGFILTFTLSAGITAGRNLFSKYIRYGPIFIKELISASLSAAIISLPLSLFFFKRYSLISFLSGILLIPLSIIIIGLSFTLIPLELFPNLFSNIILYILDPFISLFFLIIDVLLNSLDMTIYRASPPVLLIMIYLIIFCLITLKKTGFISIKRFLISGLALLTIYFISPDLKYKPKNLEVYFLDVGQGDSEIVLFPDGRALLIDGGGTYYSSFEVGKKIVLPFILQKKIKIDWVAVSHTHPDHVRGIIELLKIIKPSEIWLSQKSIKDLFYLDLIKQSKNISKIIYIDSRFTKLGKNYKIECLYPKRVINEEYTRNNNSQVLKVSDTTHSFLFTGDIEKKTEIHLSESKNKSLRSTIIKVPHHGSKTSSTEIFLNSVKPKIAIFSSRENNRFGFPHKSVIDNYQKIKSRMLFTAKSGGIKIVSTKKGIIVKTSKIK